MKVSANIIDFLERVAETARMVGIESILIEKNLIRGMDEGKTVAILQDVKENLPFSGIGLTRASLFLSRLEVAKTRDNVTVDMELEKENVKLFTFKSAGMRMDYRCGNPSTVQAPRQINDTMKYSMTLNGEAVALLQKGANAMGGDLVAIAHDGVGVQFEIIDINGDVFSYTFTKDIKSLDDDGEESEVGTFTFSYPIKLILTLFKQIPDGSINIGKKGMLCMNINGIDIYVLPRI